MRIMKVVREWEKRDERDRERMGIVRKLPPLIFLLFIYSFI